MDEIFFFGYRKVELTDPVFIISNPRSGTTFLHRLLCGDRERFVHMKLYQTLVGSISFYSMVGLLIQLNRAFGNIMNRFICWLEARIFSGWEGIHDLGFNQSEEDEGIWFFAWNSPAIGLVSPFYKEFSYLSLLDNYPEKPKRGLMNFYKNTIRRIHFSAGRHKTLLIKSVMSSGRIDSYYRSFPNARFIYINRDPLKTIPSYISMISSLWKLHSGDVLGDKAVYRDLGEAPLDFFTHFRKAKAQIPEPQIFAVEFDDLVSDPLKTVRDIYDFLDIEWNEKSESLVRKNLELQRQYRSKHTYSLQQYGIDESELRKKLELYLEA